MNFLELGLSEQTVRAIEEFGIQEPTTVQSDVIPSILEGKDVFTIAPQGCGKTMSYVFPLVDIISTKGAQNILIITPNSEQSVITSDRLAIFNKYHSINEATIKDGEEDIDNEANVIIGSPDLLVEIVENGKIDLSKTNILVVDDINLIKKKQTAGQPGKSFGNASFGKTEHCLHQPTLPGNAGSAGKNPAGAGRNQSRQGQRAGGRNYRPHRKGKTGER